MIHEFRRDRPTFNLEDIGMLDKTPDPTFERIARLTRRSINAPTVVIWINDCTAGVQVLKGSAGLKLRVHAIPLEGSLAAFVRDEKRLLSVSDVDEVDFGYASEVSRLNAQSFLAAPIFGPAGEVVGTLAAIDQTVRWWSGDATDAIRNAAFLCTEHVLFCATIATLKIISRQDSERQLPFGMRLQ